MVLLAVLLTSLLVLVMLEVLSLLPRALVGHQLAALSLFRVVAALLAEAGLSKLLQLMVLREAEQ